MDSNSKISDLLLAVSQLSIFQKKALKGLEESMDEEEKEGLDSLLDVYLKQGDTIEYLAECYIKFVTDIMEEQRFFMKHERYRYSNAKEVNSFFYQNPAYMEYYMKGLAISTYLMEAHRKCRAWYCKKLDALETGGNWLDVGVGHGEYFLLAIRHTNYDKYCGIDISPTCVQMCNEMLKLRMPLKKKNIVVKEQDFFKYDGPLCDAVVLGEILEHVENPKAFLNNVYNIAGGGTRFVYLCDDSDQLPAKGPHLSI